MWRIGTQLERQFTTFGEVLESVNSGFTVRACRILTEPATDPTNLTYFKNEYYPKSGPHGFSLGRSEETAREFKPVLSQALRETDTIENFITRANTSLRDAFREFLTDWPAKNPPIDDYVPQWSLNDAGKFDWKPNIIATTEEDKNLLPIIMYEFGFLETMYGLGIDLYAYRDAHKTYPFKVHIELRKCFKEEHRLLSTLKELFESAKPAGCVLPISKLGELRRKWIYGWTEVNPFTVPKTEMLEYAETGYSQWEMARLFSKLILPRLQLDNWVADVEKNIHDLSITHVNFSQKSPSNFDLASLRIMPDVIIQLLGWKSNQIQDNTIYPSNKEISFKDKMPSLRLVDLERSVLTDQKDQISVLLGGLPMPDRNIVHLRSFYYYGPVGKTVYKPATKSPDGLTLEFTLPYTDNVMYNLTQTHIEIEGRIVNENWTSLTFNGTIVAAKEIESLIIKNLELKMGDKTIIDDAGNLYGERDRLLSLLYDAYPAQNPPDWAKTLETRRSLVDGSVFFTLQIFPFKYKNAPLFYCTGEKFKLTLTLNPPVTYINHLSGAVKQKKRLASSKITLHVEQADRTEEIVKAMAPYYNRAARLAPWTHHYVDGDIIKADPTQAVYKSKPLLKNGGAQTYFVVLKRLRTDIEYTMDESESKPLDFETFNLIQMTVREGTEQIGSTVTLAGALVPTTKAYSLYKKHAKKVKRIKQYDFGGSSFIFIFERGDIKKTFRGDVHPVKTVDKPTIELLFREPLTFDLQVIIMSSFDESYEIYGFGDVKNIKQLGVEHNKGAVPHQVNKKAEASKLDAKTVVTTPKPDPEPKPTPPVTPVPVTPAPPDLPGIKFKKKKEPNTPTKRSIVSPDGIKEEAKRPRGRPPKQPLL